MAPRPVRHSTRAHSAADGTRLGKNTAACDCCTSVRHAVGRLTGVGQSTLTFSGPRPIRKRPVGRTGRRRLLRRLRNYQPSRISHTGQLPKTTRANSRQQSLEEMSGDNNALDLAGSFANFTNLGVPHVPFHGVVLGVPISAMDLNSLNGRPHGQL